LIYLAGSLTLHFTMLLFYHVAGLSNLKKQIERLIMNPVKRANKNVLVLLRTNCTQHSDI